MTEDQLATLLQAEMFEWAKKPFDQIVNELRQPVGYEHGKDESWHQFELNLLENTPEYIHVGVSVDDGSFFGAAHQSLRALLCIETGEQSSDV